MLKSMTYILVLLFGLLHLAGCKHLDENTGSGPGTTEELPDQESWNSRIILSDRGTIVAIMMAGHVKQFEKKRTAEIDSGLTVDFFDKDGRHSSVLTADRGTYTQKNRDMTASGNVVVISDAGDTLRTEELKWNNDQRKILAEGRVRISNAQGVQTGIGLESSADLKDWTLKEVTGVYEGELDWFEEP